MYMQPAMAPETVEATYDQFLAEFPLCFGYWNKVRERLSRCLCVCERVD